MSFRSVLHYTSSSPKVCEQWEDINGSHPSPCLVWQEQVLDPSSGFVIVRADGSGAELIKADILLAESF